MADADQRAASTWLYVRSLLIPSYVIHLLRRHPTEPQCSYDPVEGLPLAPDIDPSDKIRELEEQVGTYPLLSLALETLTQQR